MSEFDALEFVLDNCNHRQCTKQAESIFYYYNGKNGSRRLDPIIRIEKYRGIYVQFFSVGLITSPKIREKSVCCEIDKIQYVTWVYHTEKVFGKEEKCLRFCWQVYWVQLGPTNRWLSRDLLAGNSKSDANNWNLPIFKQLKSRDFSFFACGAHLFMDLYQIMNFTPIMNPKMEK